MPLPLDAPEKRFWQRYIYLWLNYAIWEEVEAEDPASAREVYRNCLKLVPHHVFTFAKVGGPLPATLMPATGYLLRRLCSRGAGVSTQQLAAWCAGKQSLRLVAVSSCALCQV